MNELPQPKPCDASAGLPGGGHSLRYVPILLADQESQGRTFRSSVGLSAMPRQLSRPKYTCSGATPPRLRAPQDVSGRGSVGEDDMMRRLGGRAKFLAGRWLTHTPWPNLNIHDKDAEAYQNWCVGVEEVLTTAFPDARCPYRFLDQKKRSPCFEEVQQLLTAQWNFQEFIKDCDFPDDENFETWCTEMQQKVQKH